MYLFWKRWKWYPQHLLGGYWRNKMGRDILRGSNLCYYTIRAKGNNKLVSCILLLRITNHYCWNTLCYLVRIISNNTHNLSIYYVIIATFVAITNHLHYPPINDDWIMCCCPKYFVKSINMLLIYSAVICDYPPNWYIVVIYCLKWA